MKILLDDGLSTTVELTGIGHQCLGLYRSLSKHAEVRLANYHLIRHFPKQIRRATYLALVNTRRRLASVDVAHFINFYAPWMPSRCAKVITIHDLEMFQHPELMPRRYLHYIRRAVMRSQRRADLIIVPSFTIKNELAALFPTLSAKKIAVCFNGLRDIFWNQTALEYSNNFGWKDKSFFLFVGTLLSRKKVDFLLDCFCEARKTRAIKGDTTLVLAGRKGPGFEQIERRIPEDGSVKLLGHISDQDLVRLYRHAKAFIYPSQYEGFGIPLIEAMSCGTPIIRSEIAASAEIDRRHHSQMFTFSFNASRTLVEKLAELDRMADQIRAKLDYGDLSIYQFENVARQHLAAYQLATELKS
jgi:glycosyltransferase involved in cell wall biosynthesis